MIKIAQYLGDTGVPFWSEGKNVTEGWTTITCPFCSDRSNHGGFSPDGRRYSCFRCGKAERSVDVVAHLSSVSFSDAKEMLSQYTSKFDFYEAPDIQRASKVEWPPEYTEEILPSLHAQYLKERKYNVRMIRELYDVRAMYTTGDFNYRLLVPVYLNGRVVTYIGRDVTNLQHLPYKNLKEELSVYPAKECIYNIDNVGKRGIISEGVFDSWRFRFNALCLFGLVFTRRQIQILSDKLDEAYICFDNEPQAIEQAEYLAQELSLAGVTTEILLIDQEDPALISQKEADRLLFEIFGDTYE